MHNKILVLRVKRTAISQDLPFEKMYLVHKSRRSEIPKLFKYAFVAPINEALRNAIATLDPKKMTGYEGSPPNAFPKTNLKTWWEENVFIPYNIKERVAVIPVLVKNTREGCYPKYFTSAPLRRGTRRRYRYTAPPAPVPVLSELTYLSTPGKIYQPVCNACTQTLSRLAGACHLGTAECKKGLNLAVTGTACQPTQTQP